MEDCCDSGCCCESLGGWWDSDCGGLVEGCGDSGGGGVTTGDGETDCDCLDCSASACCGYDWSDCRAGGDCGECG